MVRHEESTRPGGFEDAAADALGRWTDAVLLVDGQSGLHAANEAAESLLRLGDGLALEPDRGLGRGRLRAATPAGTAVLRRLIAAAAALAVPRTGAPALPPRDMALALVRASGRPALAALVAPLSPACAVDTSWVAALSADVSRAAAVLFVSDPTATAGDATALLRLRINYGLTPAEAAIAVAVAGGQGLQAVAAAQGVALATVRTQVQHAYRKAGVRGQAALARLVERLAQVRS